MMHDGNALNVRSVLHACTTKHCRVLPCAVKQECSAPVHHTSRRSVWTTTKQCRGETRRPGLPAVMRTAECEHSGRVRECSSIVGQCVVRYMQQQRLSVQCSLYEPHNTYSSAYWLGSYCSITPHTDCYGQTATTTTSVFPHSSHTNFIPHITPQQQHTAHFQHGETESSSHPTPVPTASSPLLHPRMTSSSSPRCH